MTRNAHRPRLEHLESRTLLATCHVTRLGDFGAGADAGGGHSRGDLRFCINKANTEPGPDTILFSRTGTIRLSSALPDIDDDLTIDGPGARLVTVDAQQKARVFKVNSGATVEISGLTMRGGSQGGSNTGGGGILNAGDLILRNCAVLENTIALSNSVRAGGGIYNSGTLEVSNCSVSENSVPFAVAVSGGGIYNALGATLVVNDSLITNNWMGEGLSSYARGAGVFNEGTATIIRTTISGNTGNTVASQKLYGVGGGIANFDGVLTVDSSLISNNVTAGDYYAYGGGIANWSGQVTVVNTTIANNLAFVEWADGLGVCGGGGISNYAFDQPGGTFTISHSTIANNHCEGGDERAAGTGGGIYKQDGEFHMHDTVVAGNGAITSGDDIAAFLNSSGYNLVENSAEGSGYAPTDILDVEPMLGPLQHNGGPTLTMTLLPGSPAIDAGDPNPVDPPTWDQRGPGFPRIVNGRLDIGAFEVQATGMPRPVAYLAVFSTADFDDDE
jgi:hypothetical protein